MRLISLALAFLIATGAASSHADAKDAQEAKTVIIESVINASSMAPVTKYVGELSTAPIVPENLNIILNSPGGSVTAGFVFIDRLSALKARGTHVSCYVADLAASMAFQILTQCDERHTMETSFLLWHRARVFLGGMMGTAMTGPELYALGVQLKDLDEHIYRDVRNSMSGAPDHYTSFHFEKETLHTGANLAAKVPGFITADANPAWIAKETANKDAIRTSRGSIFDVFKFGELIYIWTSVLDSVVIGG